VRNQFGFHDHSPPPLDLMISFSADVAQFLNAVRIPKQYLAGQRVMLSFFFN
jgi:hypothetical protein